MRAPAIGRCPTAETLAGVGESAVLSPRSSKVASAGQGVVCAYAENPAPQLTNKTGEDAALLNWRYPQT
jgi:hypothetical protein